MAKATLEIGLTSWFKYLIFAANPMKFIFLVFSIFLITDANSQKYNIDKSSVSFFSHATVEDIAAKNEKSAGLFNASTAEIVFSIPIKDFKFAKSLMQEHFNEKYLESDVFPKSTFQGHIEGFDLILNQKLVVVAKGKLTMHGQSNDVEIPGTIEKQGDRLVFNAKFIVKLADYKISIPQLLWQNIAEQVEVTANFEFKPQ